MTGQKPNAGRHRVVAAVVIITIVAAGAAVLWRGSRAPDDPASATEAWFTTDDGKTWFADSAAKLSPFEHAGKLAYRCYVFTCDGGATKFVSHLERHPAGAHKALNKGAPFDPMRVVSVEVKDPLTGEKGWTPQTNPRADVIKAPRCPDHPDRTGEPVLP